MHKSNALIHDIFALCQQLAHSCTALSTVIALPSCITWTHTTGRCSNTTCSVDLQSKCLATIKLHFRIISCCRIGISQLILPFSIWDCESELIVYLLTKPIISYEKTFACTSLVLTRNTSTRDISLIWGVADVQIVIIIIIKWSCA